MSDNREPDVKKDIENEGRNEAYLDIDRIINEGMAGGLVQVRGGKSNIEEARDLPEEDPPHTSD
ncbi:hypothetical protein [Cytobacillus purgationiresistens]|uniref:Uncharacterized protein n=1 Tax=Cytobacillus purgationiresistens TaxID=863449 RepID=A0ABU0AFU7_9BACI|nr:hypothetical protein [Cytobacillus purgationiresistens]MDQ0268970.1 hypothetical protein [Cytobacillus purgationiresistens]